MPRRPTLFLALLAAGLSTPATAQPPADLELVPTGAPASTAVAMRNAGLSPTFVASDLRLVNAARDVGLPVIDPTQR